MCVGISPARILDARAIATRPVRSPPGDSYPDAASTREATQAIQDIDQICAVFFDRRGRGRV